MTNTFATCSFPEYKPEIVGGIPVRSSNGTPRYTLKYPLPHAMPVTFPHRSYMRRPLPEFRALYRRQIERVGLDMLRKEIERIRVAAGAGEDVRLVLLCFEQLGKKPGVWCHRHIFAALWTEMTGEDVPEYGSAPKPPEIRSEQSGLF